MSTLVYESRSQRSRRKALARLFFVVSLSVCLLASLVLISTVIQLFGNTSDVSRSTLSVIDWLNWSFISFAALFCSTITWYFRHPQARFVMTCAALLVIADSLFFLVKHSG